ncbi:MAG: purine-binding chemotaxis protein CheW [Nitrospirae bacterium]|nr:MAG: purine-binding chemotaxis protein CheW [Nitrospirota bacterium]
MDIAKIRKKAREQGQEKKAEESPAVIPGTAGVPPQDEPAPVKADEPDEAAAPEAAEKPAPSPAARDEANEEDQGIAELLTFSLDKEEFAFRVTEVEEIIRFQRITIVPTVPEYVAGITSLRGKIIPVIDLKTRLALHKRTARESAHAVTSGIDGVDNKGKIIVLAGPRGLIGVIIDKVMGVVRLPDDIILEPPPHLSEEETKYIGGVVIVDKRFISIIRSEDALDIEVE